MRADIKAIASIRSEAGARYAASGNTYSLPLVEYCPELDDGGVRGRHRSAIAQPATWHKVQAAMHANSKFGRILDPLEF